MDRIKTTSRRLRGGTGPNDLIPEIRDIIQTQVSGLQSMQMQYQSGDEQGAATAFKDYIGDTSSLAEASKETGSLVSGYPDFALEDIPDLNDIPDSQIVEQFKHLKLDELVEQMEDVVQILENVKSAYPPSQEPLDDHSSFYGSKKHTKFGFDDVPFEQFSTGGKKTMFSPWNFARMSREGQKLFRQAKKSHRGGLPKLSKFLGGDNAPRRLKIEESHQMRLSALPVCQAWCTPDDLSCNCGRLVNCIGKMTEYDIAMLFVKGYVDTDVESDTFANFTIEDTTDLNLFDVDFDIQKKKGRAV